MTLRLFGLLFLLCSFHFAIGQNSIVAGIITDENDNPVAGATIKVSKAGRTVTAISDNDGLFYTKLLPSGTYHLDVLKDEKLLNARRIYLPPMEKKKVYFRLKVVDDNVRITVEGQDPFMKNRLGKIEANDDNIMDWFRFRVPSNAIDAYQATHFLISTKAKR